MRIDEKIDKYLGEGNIIDTIKKDIDKLKKALTKKAKSKGIYENFGQKEVRKLEDKYSDYQYKYEDKEAWNEIRKFDYWCMTQRVDSKKRK